MNHRKQKTMEMVVMEMLEICVAQKTERKIEIEIGD
jgi:hypothetical protein